MKSKIYNFIGKITSILLSFLMIIIFILLLFQRKIDYKYKVNFLCSNLFLVLISIALLIIIVIIYKRFGKYINSFINRLPKWFIIFLSFILFLVLGFVFYHTYFITGWDSQIIVEIASYLSEGWVPKVYHSYLSFYPNNLLMTWIYSILFKISTVFYGINPIYFSILFQSFLACLTGYLLFLIVKNISRVLYAYIVWFIYVIHIAINPWISILYSDSLALIFPILIIWLYQQMENGKNIKIKWSLIGFFSYIGFKIKPQVFIVVIAIFIVESLKLIINCDKSTLIIRVKSYLSFIISLILTLIFCNVFIFSNLNLEINSEDKVTISHYLMMGLNYETNGTYSYDDVLLSQFSKSITERKERNYDVINQRLTEMKFNGLVKHLAKKSLVIYGDGTYAWMQEGNFFAREFDDRNSIISPFLKSIYYGDNYKLFSTFKHMIWLIIIIGTCGVFLYFYQSNKPNSIIFVMVISLIGLFLFEILFEARARYLFIYIPFYIIIALYGWLCILKLANNLWKKVYKIQ